ncbi:MAG: hypothetical protein JRI57_10850 [Deltaproteobacteria bacterium]|nr:hypothetical protein [Deltaproteobacteria bacterium]MBW1953452.1 hypothetical protein [Deltaproteobacteria bacterium]MBW1987506.1 hypothetical protein [Deltaproteobacteria bacterium]MBW2135918.1 hypothetical protein [Deltaproteobacteria bacterium]
MKKKLVGKKTYLVALALALLTFARAGGWIDDNIYETLLGIMSALGLGALRAGLAKANDQQASPRKIPVAEINQAKLSDWI